MMTKYVENSPSVVLADAVFPRTAVKHVDMPRLSKEGEAMIQPRFSALAEAFRGDISASALSGMETVVGTRRFAASRGNRLIAGWEAAALDRARRLQTMAHVDQQGQRYTRVLTMLWTRYLMALNRRHVSAHYPVPEWSQPNRPAPCPINAQASPFENLSAILDPANPNVDPEAALWTGASLDDIANGSAVFLDVDGLADDTIFELIRCFLPFTARDAWAWEAPAVERTPATPAVSELKEGDRVVRPATAAKPAVMSTARTWWMLPSGLVVDGAKKIFLHWGTERPRYTADQLNLTPGTAGAIDIFARPPNTLDTMNAISHLVNRHHCGTEARNAFDLAVWRLYGFKYQDSPVAASNAPNAMVPCLGTMELSLPRDYTAPAYFDAFRNPLPTPRDVSDLLAAPASAICWGSFVLTIAGACGLNWAAYAFSLTGEAIQEWRRRPNNPNQFVAVHTTSWLNSLLPDQSNPWSNGLANCIALMYGFAPHPDTRLCMARTIDNSWKKYCAPYFTLPYHEMWALSVLPSHQMLPLPQTTPLWQEDEPRPTAGLLDFSGKVRLARDLPRFSGRSWLQDGGSAYSLQHYASMGSGADPAPEYRCTSLRTTRHVKLAAWDSPFQFDLPSDPATFDIEWAAPTGSPFADFVVPGSVRTFDLPNNRLRALAVLNGWKNSCGAYRGLNLAMFNAARNMPLQGVCVTYLHPLPAMREFEEVQDYSMIEVISKETGTFAGLITVSKQTDPSSFAHNSYFPEPAASWRPHEPAPTNIPGHLANHNDVGIPKAPKTSSVRRTSPPANVLFTAKPAGQANYLARRRIAKRQTDGRKQSEAPYDPQAGGAITQGYLARSPSDQEEIVQPPAPRVYARGSGFEAFDSEPQFQEPGQFQVGGRGPRHTARKSFTKVKVGDAVYPRPIKVAHNPSGSELGYRAEYASKNPNAVSELPKLGRATIAPTAGEAVERRPAPRAPQRREAQVDWDNTPAAPHYHEDVEVSYAPVEPGADAGARGLVREASDYQPPVVRQQQFTVPASTSTPARAPELTDQAAATAQHQIIDMSGLPGYGPSDQGGHAKDVTYVTSQFLPRIDAKRNPNNPEN